MNKKCLFFKNVALLKNILVLLGYPEIMCVTLQKHVDLSIPD